MGEVLGIVYRSLATHLVHKAGFRCNQASTGAVTLIQRFGSALNLNIHFHLLVIDGAYLLREDAPPLFHRTKAPDRAELEVLVQRISKRNQRPNQLNHFNTPQHADTFLEILNQNQKHFPTKIT